MMGKEMLQNMFCEKITMELELFKAKMLRKKPEEILNSAYKIDCTINIYELLIEKSRKMPEGTLKAMLVFPHLLAFLYAGWLKMEDSHLEEIWSCLDIFVAQIRGHADGKEETKK